MCFLSYRNANASPIALYLPVLNVENLPLDVFRDPELVEIFLSSGVTYGSVLPLLRLLDGATLNCVSSSLVFPLYQRVCRALCSNNIWSCLHALIPTDVIDRHKGNIHKVMSTLTRMVTEFYGSCSCAYYLLWTHYIQASESQNPSLFV